MEAGALESWRPEGVKERGNQLPAEGISTGPGLGPDPYVVVLTWELPKTLFPSHIKKKKILLYYLFLEIGSHYVVLAGLQLTM